MFHLIGIIFLCYNCKYIETYDEARLITERHIEYSDSDAAAAADERKQYLRKHPLQRLGYFDQLPDCNQLFNQVGKGI